MHSPHSYTCSPNCAKATPIRQGQVHTKSSRPEPTFEPTNTQNRFHCSSPTLEASALTSGWLLRSASPQLKPFFPRSNKKKNSRTRNYRSKICSQLTHRRPRSSQQQKKSDLALETKMSGTPRLTLPNVPLITGCKKFCSATRWAKAVPAAKASLGRDTLSLPRQICAKRSNFYPIP